MKPLHTGLEIRTEHTGSLPSQFLVHPDLLWVEAESTAVEEDGGFEISSISESADASFDGHDFAVDSFGHAIGDMVRAVADHVGETCFDGTGDSLHWREPGVNHSLVPVIEIRRRRGCGVLSPEITKHFLEGPGFAGFELQAESRLESRLLFFVEILVAGQPQILRLTETVVTHFKEFAMLTSTYFIDRFRRHLHNVKSVVNDFGFCQGNGLFRRLDVGGTHVHGDGFDRIELRL
jgi:hypothetical protein